MGTLEVVTDQKSVCGEGPVWDRQTNSIYWIDIVTGDIHRYQGGARDLVTLNVGQKIGAIAQCRSGHLVAAIKTGLSFIDFDNKSHWPINDPEADIPGNRFNDGKCDPSGRFWAGTMDDGHGLKAMGSLYTLERDLMVKKKQTGLTIPNGLVWDADKKTFYHIDTPTRKVMAFDYDDHNGEISNPREIISIPQGEGAPDGMAIDDEGMLWIAHWDGWKVSRWCPDTGSQLDGISLPVARVTSCTFGGKDLGDLYITTAKVGLSDEELLKQPLAGSLFVIKDSGYKGLPANTFDNRGAAMELLTGWRSF